MRERIDNIMKEKKNKRCGDREKIKEIRERERDGEREREGKIKERMELKRMKIVQTQKEEKKR